MAVVPQVIRFKRRIPGTGAPAAGEVVAGEPAVSVSATGVAELYVGDGSAARTLVSNARQVELAGAQTITGVKTIAVANLHVTGGNPDDLVKTDGAGNLSFTPPPRPVTVGGSAPGGAQSGDLWFNTATGKLMVHNGSTFILANGVINQIAQPAAMPNGTAWFNTDTHVLSVYDGTNWNASTGNRIYTGGTTPTGTHAIGDTWWSSTGPQHWNGSAWVAATLPAFAGVAVNNPITGNGTTGNALGVTPATTADVTAGTDDIFPLTSLKLRQQLGGDRTDLLTSAQTVVPAINELRGEIGAVTGGLRFVGSYNAATNAVVPASGGPAVAGPLPAASATNNGWFLIVTTSGTGTGNAPAIAMAIGDWLVSNGSAWVHVPLAQEAITASNVGITALDSQTWVNVQAALQGLFTRSTTAGNTAVLADHTSILGDGTSATATATVGLLRVGEIDGGTF